MSAPRMRPTFELETHREPVVIMSCIQGAVGESSQFEGQFTRHHAMVSIERSKRHFWSPWLHLDIRNENGQRLLFGRFSPHPSIWTGFMFAYLALAVLAFFAVVFGLSQQMAGQTPWAYYAVPVCALVAVGLWLAAQAGQKLAQKEMADLKLLIESCLKTE